MPPPIGTTGAAIGGLIVVLWAGLLGFLLAWYQPDWRSPAPYLLVLLQTHLYTGLFITAHDAMHGVVSPNKRLNNALGTLAAGLFAYNWFPGQLPKHHAHHRHVGTPDDPDFHDGRHPGFLPWFLRFAWNYVTWWQVLLMAADLQRAEAVLPAGQCHCLLDDAGGAGHAAAVLLWYLPAAPGRARARQPAQVAQPVSAPPVGVCELLLLWLPLRAPRPALSAVVAAVAGEGLNRRISQI